MSEPIEASPQPTVTVDLSAIYEAEREWWNWVVQRSPALFAPRVGGFSIVITVPDPEAKS